MRVRFEIRQLPPGQWDKVVRALWIMKLTDMAEGKRVYGSSFVTYDYMVAKHMKAALNIEGDQAHFTPVFPLFHRLWLLEIENSLLAIDNTISGLPYWNCFHDGLAVFNNEYMGSPPTTSNSYRVIDGRFANWRIPLMTDRGLGLSSGNMYGYARSPLNPNKEPVITRNIASLCGINFGFGEPASWDFCAARDSNIYDYQLCIDGGIHGRAHMTIGGSWQRPSQILLGQDTSILCAQWYGQILNTVNDVNITRKGRGSFINAFVAEPSCFDCKCCALDQSPDECLCDISTTSRALGCGPLWTGLQTIDDPAAGIDARATLAPEHAIEIVGDFLDPIASANDPIFLFHHANVDRNYEKWLRKHLYRQGEWLPLSSVQNFLYPTTGLVRGSNLHDILAEYNAPFSDLLGESKEGKLVYNYTVLQALETYSQQIYIYNNLDLEYASGSFQSTVPLQGMNVRDEPEIRRANTGILLLGEYWNPVMFTFALSAVFGLVVVVVALVVRRKVGRPHDSQMPREV